MPWNKLFVIFYLAASPVFAQTVTTLTREVRNPYGLVIGPDKALYICEIDRHVHTEVGVTRHGIDQARAIDELAFTFNDRIIKLGQVFGRDGQIGIQNHEYITGGRFKSLTHSRAFALGAGLGE